VDGVELCHVDEEVQVDPSMAILGRALMFRILR